VGGEQPLWVSHGAWAPIGGAVRAKARDSRSRSTRKRDELISASWRPGMQFLHDA
jgi:hypothetical protein